MEGNSGEGEAAVTALKKDREGQETGPPARLDLAASPSGSLWASLSSSQEMGLSVCPRGPTQRQDSVSKGAFLDSPVTTRDKLHVSGCISLDKRSKNLTQPHPADNPAPSATIHHCRGNTMLPSLLGHGVSSCPLCGPALFRSICCQYGEHRHMSLKVGLLSSELLSQMDEQDAHIKLSYNTLCCLGVCYKSICHKSQELNATGCNLHRESFIVAVGHTMSDSQIRAGHLRDAKHAL